MVEYALPATAESKMIPWQAEISKQRGKGNMFKVKASAFTKAWSQHQARYRGRREQNAAWLVRQWEKGKQGRVTNKAG